MTTLLSRMQSGDFIAALTAEGRVFNVSDADQNDTVIGQTGFLVTTPTFQLDVPDGTTALPLLMSLNQTSPIAGGAITVIIEIDNADRYASGGTAETVLASRTDGLKTNLAVFRSNPTAESGYGVNIFRTIVGEDISTAEGAVNEILWTPPFSAPPLLIGPAAFNVYTFASTTGPTWFWNFMWAELPTSEAI